MRASCFPWTSTPNAVNYENRFEATGKREEYLPRSSNDVVQPVSELKKRSTEIPNDSDTSSIATKGTDRNNANGGDEEKKVVEIGKKRDRVEGEEKHTVQKLAEAEMIL